MRKPNFDRLAQVLYIEGEPDYIPFYELFADREIMDAVVGETTRRTPINPQEDIKRYFRDLADYETNLGIAVKFYCKLGYDYVPLEVPSLLLRDNIRLSVDVASLPRPVRTWQDENRGVIETREDFEKYPWPGIHEIQENFLPMYDFLNKRLPDDVMIIGGTAGGILENVMWLMGAVPFFRALYKDPFLIRDMFEKIGTILSLCCDLVADLDRVGALHMGDDMGYKKGPMMSLENFRKYVFPWQKRCVDAAHKHGKPFILHTCGNLELLMDDLIDYVGIDAKQSYEDTSYPVTEYKKKYGHRIAILGGIDMDKLTRAPMDEFRLYVRERIRECAPGGGYALGCGNTVANYVKLENYLAMLEIGRKYGRYPPRFLNIQSKN